MPAESQSAVRHRKVLRISLTIAQKSSIAANPFAKIFHSNLAKLSYPSPSRRYEVCVIEVLGPSSSKVCDTVHTLEDGMGEEGLRWEGVWGGGGIRICFHVTLVVEDLPNQNTILVR